MLIYRIDKIRILLLTFPVKIPRQIIERIFYARSCGTKELHLWVNRMNRLFKLHMAFKNIHVLCLPLLISNRKHLKVKRLWMPHLCTESAPLALHRTVRKLNQIQCILYKLPELLIIDRHQLSRAELAGRTHSEYRKRLCAQKLTEHKILIKTDSIGLSIMCIRALRIQVFPEIAVILECPEIRDVFPILQLSHSFLPLIAVF